MNAGQKLTKRFIESIKPHEKNEILMWDSELKGFGVRIFPTGRRTYFVQYRNQLGSTRRKKIGVHGVLTAELARDEAKKLLGDIAKGEDPSKKHQLLKQKPRMTDLAIEYLEMHAKPNKCYEAYIEDKRKIEKIILKKFGDRKIEEITTRELQLLHYEFKEMPYKANSLRALLSKMFNLAIQRGWLEINPTKGVEKYFEEKRQRWLRDEELERLWLELDQYFNQSVANVIRLLLLTGSRRNEVLSSTWDQFDLDEGVWTKPAHTTKQRRTEYLPLSTLALDILKNIKSHSNSHYLFPGKVSGKPLQEIKKAWHTIRKRAGIPDVRIHDLRHTHASHLVSSGLSLSIVGKLLGHTQASTTQRYAHLADEPLRQAAELFGSKLKKLTSDKRA